MTIAPERYASSIAAWTSTHCGSGNISRTGAPRPSRPPRAMVSSSQYSMTWSGPRKSVTAAIGSTPTPVILAAGVSASPHPNRARPL